MECLPEIDVDILFDAEDEKRRDDRNFGFSEISKKKKSKILIFSKFLKIENKRRARREKREKTKIPPEWTPCVRDTNWFLVRREI